ncbi:MAG: hypothetical protein DWP92_05305 [Armatimonadetes bacterium]|nr:MAG: hypothetical protein DWP92_05305 [Armatimonadota bacterium]
MTGVLEGTLGTSTDAPTNMRAAGVVALVGAIVMVVGAGLYASSGADAWAAVSSGDTQKFLNDAAASATTFYAGLSAWITGAILMAVGGGLVAGVGSGFGAPAARTTLAIGAAVAVPAFVVLATVVRLAASGSTSLDLADSLAFLGTTLDDVATIIIIGVSPVLIGLSGHGRWMPRWLYFWALACGVAGVIATVAVFLGMSSTLGMILVPVGIGWMFATGVVAIRHR